MTTCHPASASSEAFASSTAAPLIALAGQPNVGKTTVFNALTGMNQHVGNWPGKTVEQKCGVWHYAGATYTLVDLPGTYSLTANSEEERIARDFILHQKPDVVIAVVDAANLERSLYLVAELLLLPAPLVLALNMMDVAEGEGLHIEAHVLEAALGVPVVPMAAGRGRGIEALRDTVARMVRGEIPYDPQRPLILPPHAPVLEEVAAMIEGYIPSTMPVTWAALKVLEGDAALLATLHEQLPAERWQALQVLLHAHEDAMLDIIGARYAWVARMVRAAVAQPQAGQLSWTRRLDEVLTHPVWGTLSLVGILGGAFRLTYALALPVQRMLADGFAQGAAWLSNGLATAPGWIKAVLIQGAFNGAGMVITFLPLLVIFYVLLALLEDTGYMARIAYLMDTVMHRLGLHGKSFMPLLLGFGCNVPAVLGTRIIESRAGRLLTMVLVPLVPCAARLAVLGTLAPVFFGAAASWAMVVLVLVNLALLFGLGLVLHRFLFRGEDVAFVMEMPLYHVPNPRTVGLYVWHHVRAFVQKAATVILAVSVAMAALAYFPTGDVMTSYLARIGEALAPVGRLMGVPWPLLMALLTSFIAKENTLATLGVLYGDVAVLRTLLTPLAAMSYLVTQMVFIPCAATVAALKQELASWRALFGVVMLYLALSLGAGIAIYQLGQFVIH